MTGRIVWPWRRSLRARLVAYFLLLSTVTVVVVGGVVNVRATSDLTNAIYDRLDAVAAIKADALNRWIDEQTRNVVYVGSIPGFGDDARVLLDPAAGAAERDGASQRLRTDLATVVSKTADAEEIFILDLDGTIRLSTLPQDEGTSQASEPFFVDGSSHTTVQNVYSSSLTNRPTITVATPLFDQNGGGQRVAVLAANLSLQRVDRIVQERTGLGQTGRTYLVGPDGRLIQGTTQAGGAGDVVDSAGIRYATAQHDGQGLYIDDRGVPVIGVYRWLGDRGAALMAEISQDEAFASARQLALTIGLVGLLSAVLLVAGIWLVARQVTRPILALAATATRVAAGDLEATTGVRSEDEVGALAVAFDGMTAQLRENVANLERRVTERTAELSEALEAQRAAEARYRKLVEELPLAVYMDKPDNPMGGVLYVSPPIEAIFGYPAEDWLHDSFFGSVIHPDDRERVVDDQAAQHGNEDRATAEYRIVAMDGRVVWVRDDNVVVRDKDGVAQYVLGFFLDITDQTLIAAEVRRQKQYFESLVEVSPVAVVTMDPREQVTAWNPAAQTLFGFAPEEAIGRHVDQLILRSESLRDEGHDLAREAAEAGRAHRTGRRMHKDGSLIDVEVLMVPLVIDGEQTGFYAIYHDVTELEAARRDADAANQAKSSFLAAMSHEIRTPMNAVIGMSGLLLDTSLDSEQRDYTETINTSGEALLTIINDILDFSKIEAGRFELDAHPFVLAATVEGALDVMGPIAAKKGIELAYSLDPELPRTVVGDAGRLRQIVLNLLSNAIKFTEAGEVVLAMTGHRIDAGGADEIGRWEIQLEIHDTGIGIPADRIGRLFQSFSQADASISRRFGGTGLGLAISRRLAELMEGSLVAESTGVPGEGSTFRLTISLAAAADVVAPAEGAPTVDLTGRRALVVDDNATNRRILVSLLERWGLVVTATGSSLEGRDLGRRPGTFDIVVTDLRMPDLDGVGLADSLREAHPAGDLPVVVLSSLGQRERATPAVAAFLTKPVKPAALHDTLAQVLTGQSSRATTAAPERTSLDGELAARHPLRILLAEDNPVNQKLARRLLERLGYAADLAENGLAAIEALEGTAYDLVLMDVQMPELDGLEATRRIRARWPERPLRIVAMTANAMEGDRETCLAAGMDDYLSKPIRPAELTAALVGTPGTVAP